MRDRQVLTRDPKVYARKGEQVACRDGCLVGTFTRDVMRDEEIDSSTLDLTEAAPFIGEPAKCRLCGAPVLAARGVFFILEPPRVRW